jgi:hypothetical protein
VQLSPALRKTATSLLLDQSVVLVSMAVAIALGAVSMSGIALLALHMPILATLPYTSVKER